MTTTERIAASEADLATVSVSEGMDAPSPPAPCRRRMPRPRPVPRRGTAARVQRDDRDDTREARTRAVRALEAEFGELITRFRRIIADNADRVSPGMLPAAYEVFTTIVRRESITLSALAEALVADKGQISRTVREPETLGLVGARPTPTTADRAFSPPPPPASSVSPRRIRPSRGARVTTRRPPASAALLRMVTSV